jgi:hypothetical protein
VLISNSLKFKKGLNLMKKTISVLLVLVLTLSVVIPNVFAKEKDTRKVYTENQLNTLLTKAKVPLDVLYGMDVDTKRFIIENSGEELKFVNSDTDNFVRKPQTGELAKVQSDSNVVNPMAYIPSSDLSLTLSHFVNAQGLDDIYSQFEWKRTGSGPSDSPNGIYKDNIGIAVPSGWEIQSGKYACTTTAWVIDSWGYASSSGCNNGQPTEYNLYGASWQFTFDQGLTSYRTFYKGIAKLTMKKKSSNAINRTITKYSEAKSNILGNYAVTVGWGPVSIIYTPTSGSNNEASIDLSW